MTVSQAGWMCPQPEPQRLPPHYRRLTAAVLLNAIRVLEFLRKPHAPASEFFEGWDALVWLASPDSTPFFEVLGRDSEVARESLHLNYYAHVAMCQFRTRYIDIRRLTINLVRYSLQIQHRRLPYTQVLECANKLVDHGIAVLSALKVDYHPQVVCEDEAEIQPVWMGDQEDLGGCRKMG